MEDQPKDHSGLLLFIGILFLIWGVFGIIDSSNYVYSGYLTGGDNAILEVDPESPAEEAGLRAGDIIVSTGGIYTTDTKALSARERPSIGESREFVLERNGEKISTNLVYAAMPEKEKSLNIASFIMGLLFLVFGLYTHYKRKTSLSFSYAVFMLCFAFIFFDGPYFGPGVLGRMFNSLSFTIVIFSFAALANFMLYYPPKSSYNVKLLYSPAAIAALFIWILEFTLPENTTTLNLILRIFLGAVIIFYFSFSLFILIRKYLRASGEERSSSGLNLLLTGSLIGILPILLYLSISTFLPATVLPGNDYIFISFLAIPIFYTMALLQRKQETLV